MRFKKWLCKTFGCKILKVASPGFYHLECKRCGDVYRLTSKDRNWYDRACRCIAMECSLFGTSGNTIEDYRNYGDKHPPAEGER